jgi:hypothetical protein
MERRPFLRDVVARLYAQSIVMVIDTRGELGGLGCITHQLLGHVRRMVPRKGLQAFPIRDAVRLHAVNVVVVDELCGVEEFSIVQEVRMRKVRVIAGCPRELEYVVTDFDAAVEILSYSWYCVHDFEKGTHEVRKAMPNGAIAARIE